MPVLLDWKLELNADQVLRAQGADPEVIRRRKPMLAGVAGWAVKEGLPLLAPAVVYEEYRVEAFKHERLGLVAEPCGRDHPAAYPGCSEGSGRKVSHPVLSGPLVAQHLAAAEKVIVLVCTVGGLLEEVTGALLATDPLQGFALDGAGTAAVEVLAAAACNYFEAQAAAVGLQISLPLSPGMIGWPVEVGQQQVFALVDGNEIGVRLTAGQQMQPRKSLSLVLGVGKGLGSGGRTCDYCGVRATCRWKEHYAGSKLEPSW